MKKVLGVIVRIIAACIVIISLVMIGLEDSSARRFFTTSGDISQKMVVPCGDCVGFYLETKGVVVVNIATLSDMNGNQVRPAEHSLKIGDYILSVNGVTIRQKEDLIKNVALSGPNPLQIILKRDGKMITTTLNPVECDDHEYKIGVWVRDDAQGIGTVTYITSDGTFGALGHGISEQDTGEVLEIASGKLFPSKIWSIVKGSDGIPGSMAGVICYGDDVSMGNITKNSPKGVYGTVNPTFFNRYDRDDFCQVGRKYEVTTGRVQIRCKIEGKIRDFDGEIIQVNYLDDSNKSIVLEITDRELLDMTGGIVQGMSGSPILQNGKLVGAITHVFVNDPTKGYGIFAETMIKEQD